MRRDVALASSPVARHIPAGQRLNATTMTATTYLAGIIRATMAPLFTTNSGEPSLGADAVQAAINEASAITDREFIATLGEPRLSDFGGMFQSDWKVLVDVTASDYEDPGPLVFDLPRGNEDPDALLYVLMEAVDADTIADIEGAEVPMEVVGGNPMVFWDAITAPESGTEENPIAEADIEEELDEAPSEDEIVDEDDDSV